MDFQIMIPYIYSITTDWRKELQKYLWRWHFTTCNTKTLIKLDYWTLERKFFLGHFSYDLSSWITFIELSPQIYSITFLLQHFFYGNLQVSSNFLSVILQAMLILHKLHFLIAVRYVSASSRTAWLWARFQ